MDRTPDRATHFPCPGDRIERDSVDRDSGVTDTTTDSDQTRALRREMVTALVNDGTLADDRWRDAFLTVPRHVLVPAYYQAGAHIDCDMDRQRWLELIYSDTTLVTQRRPDAVTSSGTMPSLVAMMLQALEVQDGHRVLQVGTGTGYTAALLCEWLGSAQVTSIDVDADLTAAARNRLRRCGYTPTVLTADGAHGDPERTPYDRIIATFAVASIPPAWIDQTRPGGIVLAPVFSGLAKLTVTSQGHAQGRFIGPGYFMRHRATPDAQTDGESVAEANERHWPQRTTELPASVYYDSDFRFMLDLTMPRLSHGNPGGARNDLILHAPDGSHAHVDAEGALTQSGPRRLWDDIEAIHQTWRCLGAPPRERFGLTVTPQHQTIWLDTPDSDHQWQVG
ncbi:MAG: methyltransferase domain-containing protein [Pseudonocardiaceae bacterium]|nr:methyltransferase domain-containing protein [Pseudonocardiaceae bacterium]